MTTELLPCPFCGETPYYNRTREALWHSGSCRIAGIGFSVNEWNTRRAAVAGPRGDALINEVVSVLGEIRGFFGTNECWCDSEGDAPHFEHCKAARSLYDRLTTATSSPTPAAPIEKSSPIEGEQWRQGMRDAAKEICDACADEYRYGRARKIEGSTRWWHGDDNVPCEAGGIWYALTEGATSATAPADNDAELFVLTVPEIEELIQGHESASVQLAQAGKDYGHHLRRLELLRRMLATTTKGDR